MRFQAEPFKIEFRRTDHSQQTRVTITHRAWRHAYRDLVALDWYEQRHRLARVIASRAKVAVPLVETILDACYDHWYRASRASYQAHLLAQLPDQEPLQCLLEPLLPIGSTTILVGDGGVGKSACALFLTQVWLSGSQTPVRAYRPSEPISWHYYDWERISPSVFQWRCRVLTESYRSASGLSGGYCLEERGIFYQVDTSLFDFAEQFYEMIDTHRPQLVVVDSLSAAVSASLNDEKIARDVMNLFAEIGRLGCAVLVIAHVAKEEARSKARVGPFGSRMYYNLARQVLELTADDEHPKQYLLHMTKNNYGALRKEPFRYTLDWDSRWARFL